MFTKTFPHFKITLKEPLLSCLKGRPANEIHLFKFALVLQFLKNNVCISLDEQRAVRIEPTFFSQPGLYDVFLTVTLCG